MLSDVRWSSQLDGTRVSIIDKMSWSYSSVWKWKSSCFNSFRYSAWWCVQPIVRNPGVSMETFVESGCHHIPRSSPTAPSILLFIRNIRIRRWGKQLNGTCTAIRKGECANLHRRMLSIETEWTAYSCWFQLNLQLLNLRACSMMYTQYGVVFMLSDPTIYDYGLIVFLWDCLSILSSQKRRFWSLSDNLDLLESH